jgi:hypothetical protein
LVHCMVNAGRPDLSSLDAKKHLRLVMLNFEKGC